MKKKWLFLILIIIILIISLSFRTYIEYKKDLINSKAIYDTKATYQVTSLTIMVDADAPDVFIDLPENTTYSTNISIPLNYSVSDKISNISSVWYNLDNEANTTLSANTTFSTSEGSHTLYIFANDTKNYLNDSESVAFSIVVSFLMDISDVISTTDTTPDLNVTTNLAADCEYKTPDGNYASMASTGSLNHGHTLSPLTNGDYVCWIKCTSGSSTIEDSVAFSIVSAGTPSVSSVNDNLTITALNLTEIAATTNVDINITTTEDITNGYITISEYSTNPESDTTGFAPVALGKYLTISADNNTNISLDSAMIHSYYSDSDVTNANIDESTLRMYKYTQGVGWAVLTNTGVDTDNNYIRGNTTSFSTYGMGGSAIVSSTTPPGGGGGGGSGGSGGSGDTYSIKLNKDSLKIKLKQDSTESSFLKIQNTGNKKMVLALEVDPPIDFLFIEDSFDSYAVDLDPSEKKNIEFKVSAVDVEEGIYVSKLIMEGPNLKKVIPIVIEVTSKGRKLFDIDISIPEKYKKIKAGEVLVGGIFLYNLGVMGPIETDIEYSILDLDGNVVFTETEKEVVETQFQKTKEFRLPKYLKTGKYVFSIKAKYFDGAEEKTATATTVFEIAEEKGFSILEQFDMTLALIVILALMVLTLVIYQFKILGFLKSRHIEGKKIQKKTKVKKPRTPKKVKERGKELINLIKEARRRRQ